MIDLSTKEYVLNFSFDAGTSRGVMKSRKTWFIMLREGGKTGIGECAPLKGLSIDSPEVIPDVLRTLIGTYSSAEELQSLLRSQSLENFPALRFGLEMAIRDLKNGGQRILFKSTFVQGRPIPINGLVWMGDRKIMSERIKQKVDAGFECIKIKVGALNFEDEIRLLKEFRKRYGWEIELRLDANGAFEPSEAENKLEQLSAFKVHSIEQPIEVGQWESLRKVIKHSPIPIALDEELIPLIRDRDRMEMLKELKPPFIILKPSLLGGFEETDQWIRFAENTETGWWITSALESNIGLNAIAQFTATYENPLPQGLGTGGLYLNNFKSPLEIHDASLFFNKNWDWDLQDLVD